MGVRMPDVVFVSQRRYGYVTKRIIDRSLLCLAVMTSGVSMCLTVWGGLSVSTCVGIPVSLCGPTGITFMALCVLGLSQ